MLGKRKAWKGGELSISKAEFYSLFLKAGFKSKLLFWFSIILFPTLQHSEGCVLYTWLHLEFSLAGIVTTTGSILILIIHSNAVYSFPVWNAVWVGGELWEGRLAQGGQVGFVVRWGFSVGIMRWGNCWVGLSPFFCLLCTWLSNLPPSGMKALHHPSWDWISGSFLLKKMIYLFIFLAVLGLPCCLGFSLVAESGGCSLVAALRPLILASQVAEYWLQGTWASGSCRSLALEHCE